MPALWTAAVRHACAVPSHQTAAVASPVPQQSFFVCAARRSRRAAAALACLHQLHAASQTDRQTHCVFHFSALPRPGCHTLSADQLSHCPLLPACCRPAWLPHPFRVAAPMTAPPSTNPPALMSRLLGAVVLKWCSFLQQQLGLQPQERPLLLCLVRCQCAAQHYSQMASLDCQMQLFT